MNKVLNQQIKVDVVTDITFSESKSQAEAKTRLSKSVLTLVEGQLKSSENLYLQQSG